jgi:ectoine hydroxylase-related dioxygenase (phytanoyl-CoA dioxygenase family)
MVGAARLMSPFQHCVFRMDLAGEPWRGFGWHQDFAYNVLCPRSVTAWLPLTPSGAANGGVQVAELEADRLYPVEIRYKRDPEGRRLSTRDAFIAPQFHAGFETCAVTPELLPGDVLMFRSTVVHRSGRNPGPRHRYSIQVRFGDLLAPEVVDRGWRHRRADGFETFAQLHPELIAFQET